MLAVAHCLACDHTFDTLEVVLVCPRCGSTGVSQHGGDELILESLEYRAADGAPF